MVRLGHIKNLIPVRLIPVSSRFAESRFAESRFAESRFAIYTLHLERVAHNLEFSVLSSASFIAVIRVCSCKYVCVCAVFVINLHFWLNVRCKIIHYTRKRELPRPECRRIGRPPSWKATKTKGHHSAAAIIK